MVSISSARLLLTKLRNDDSGAVTTEYIIIAGLLCIGLIGVMNAFAQAIRLWFWAKAMVIVRN